MGLRRVEFGVSSVVRRTAGGGDKSVRPGPDITRLRQASAFWALAGLTDASGNGHTLSQGSGHLVQFTGTGPGGLANTAGAFDGQGSLTLAAALVTSGPMSVSAWVKLNASANDDLTVFEQSKSAGDPAVLTANPVEGPQAAFGGGVVSNAGSTPDGTWVYLAARTDGVTQKLYVNSDLVATDAAVADFSTANAVTLGGADVFSSLTGQLALVGVYPFALTAVEVLLLYNKGAGYNPYA